MAYVDVWIEACPNTLKRRAWSVDAGGQSGLTEDHRFALRVRLAVVRIALGKLSCNGKRGLYSRLNIPFVDLATQHAAIQTEINAAIQQVLSRCNFILGSQVEAFEQAFAEFVETEHAIGVSNGLDALRLALMALDVGPGDEVLCRPTPISLRRWPLVPLVLDQLWIFAIRKPTTST